MDAAQLAAAPPQMRVCESRPADPAQGLPEAEARRVDLIWAAAVTAALLLVFLVINVSKSAGVPMLVAFALAYALDPVIDRAEARGLSRATAIALLFVVTTLAAAGFLLYLVPAIGAELGKLPEFVRAANERLTPRLEEAVGLRLPTDLREAATALGERGRGLAEKALPSLAAFAVEALGGTASLLLALLGLAVIPVIAFYLLRDWDLLVGWARELLPRRSVRLVSARFAEIDAVLSSFIRGQLTVGAILACLYAVGLSAARIDLAVVIAGVAGFGTMIPYIGPATGMLLALLSLVVSWQGPWQLALVAGTFVVVMTLEGLVLTPRIVGGKVGLSTLGVILAILVFGELFGFAGILLAVPVAASMKVVVRVVLHHYRRSALYRGEA